MTTEPSAASFAALIQSELVIMAARREQGQKESLELRIARLERIALNLCGLLAAQQMALSPSSRIPHSGD
jgi:hypothetical protein